MTAAPLTLREVRVRSVVAPMRRPLITRVIVVEQAALLLIDLVTEEGVTGHAYLVGYTPRGSAYMAPLVRDLGLALKGQPVDPPALFPKARKALTMMGHQGLALMAVAGFDMACWDARAKAEGKPLHRLLGAAVDRVRAYNSNGLGIVPPAALAAEASELVAEGGFAAVKVRLGRETLDEDLAAVRAVRAALGPDVLLPTDFNQCLGVEDAIQRGRALDSEGVYWIEEPIPYDDLAGNARVAAAVETPVQIGENLYGPEAVAAAIAAGASDCLMFDAARIGGVSGWLLAAPLAEAAGIPLSSHLYPEVSAHLLAATPARHWLEFVDWAAPVLAHPATVAGGHVIPSDRPGIGVAWNPDAVEKFAVAL